MAVPISAVILTLNEELNLEACLDSLAGWTDVFVVDSGSTDRTREIALRFGARFVEHRFVSHTEQWRWALENLPLGDWVLALDADQRVMPELRREIEDRFRDPRDLEDLAGFFLNRRYLFRGRWIRHGGYYPKHLLKLFRREKVIFDALDLVDHHFFVPHATATLKSDLIEENRKEERIAFWTEKHNRYAMELAREEIFRQENGAAPVNASFFGSPDQRTLWMKRLWRRLPLFVRPALLFAYRYFFRLGFLDGKEGFIFHALQSFWFRLLVDVNRDELETQQRWKSSIGATTRDY